MQDCRAYKLSPEDTYFLVPMEAFLSVFEHRMPFASVNGSMGHRKPGTSRPWCSYDLLQTPLRHTSTNGTRFSQQYWISIPRPSTADHFWNETHKHIALSRFLTKGVSSTYLASSIKPKTSVNQHIIHP